MCTEVGYQFLYRTSRWDIQVATQHYHRNDNVPLQTHTRISLLVTERYHESLVVASGVTAPRAEWLAGVLLPKLLQWSRGPLDSGRLQSLVPLDRYSHLYQHLKEKHGQALVKVRCVQVAVSLKNVTRGSLC